MEKVTIDLRAVFYREGDFWIAHCLEMDVMGHGKTQEKALEELTEAICIQVDMSLNNGNVANIFQPADSRFFQMYFTGKQTVQTTLEICQGRQARERVEITEIETREYQGAFAVC